MMQRHAGAGSALEVCGPTLSRSEEEDQLGPSSLTPEACRKGVDAEPRLRSLWVNNSHQAANT
jgi:hypothetical protein